MQNLSYDESLSTLVGEVVMQNGPQLSDLEVLRLELAASSHLRVLHIDDFVKETIANSGDVEGDEWKTNADSLKGKYEEEGEWLILYGEWQSVVIGGRTSEEAAIKVALESIKLLGTKPKIEKDEDD